MKRVVYMGTPRFATEPLKALIDAGYEVVAVVTAPDKPSGRGLMISESEVKRFAAEKGLKIMQPTSLKDPVFIANLISLDADLFVVVAFRMLPREVWSLPRLGCFNLHASLLPCYRGAAPINHALINGEKKTGVTTFLIDSAIDTGNILLQEECVIEESDNAGTLHDKLMKIGASLVVKTADVLIKGKILPRPQTGSAEELKTAPKLDREIGRINWEKSNTDINNLIRGLSPSPAAFTELVCNNKVSQLKIFSSELVDFASAAIPGSVIKESKTSILVRCGEGHIRILELQPAGKRRMKASEFLAGLKEPEKCLFK